MRLSKMERITQRLMLLLTHNLRKKMIRRINLRSLTMIRNKKISQYQEKLLKLQRKLLRKAKKAENSEKSKDTKEQVKELDLSYNAPSIQAYVGAELYSPRMFPSSCPSYQKAVIKLFKVEKNDKDK